MCGIAGFIGEGDRETIARMTAAIRHRGPDDEDFYADPDVRLHLGFRRLVVIDPAGGRQPMRSADGRVVLVFNGEIYNHRDLRAQLEAKGYRFASDHSDSEVLIHGYREWGEALPKRLNGMFAFAIWDRARRRLFLARDRFGEKPLFIAERDGLFAFASEATALCAHPAIEARWDRRALQKYFAYGFFPAPLTPWRGVEKLPAGHYLIHDIASGRTHRRRYWRFAVEPRDDEGDERTAAEELRHHLSRAVARRLEADVPLGFLLSGGIDSSAIVRFAADHMDRGAINTFNVGFEEASFDEAAHAQAVADHVGAIHRTRTCSLPAMKSGIPNLLARLDEPLGDSSILPTHQVCAHARQFVTVALSGDGSDELFAGYDPFRALAIARTYRRLVPQGVHRWIQALVGRMPISDANMSLDFKLRRALRGVAHPPALWNPVWMAPLAPDEIAALFGEPVEAEDLYGEAIAAWNAAASDDLVDRTSEFFTRFYLQDDILLKTDRASMLNSLELRAPFLDNDLVDFARRLPARWKYRGGTTKYLLRRAVRPLLPAEVLRRPKKGLGVPLRAWLREMTPPAGNGGLPLDETWLADRWSEHRAGRADWRHALWCWMTLRGSPVGRETGTVATASDET